MYEILTEKNFLLYAAKNYDNPQCFDDEEFQEDLKKFQYLKKLFNRYIETGDLKERLILNHIIVITNMFGPQPATKMLWLKLSGYEYYLKPFLVYLNLLPDVLIGVKSETPIRTSDYGMDQNIIDKLRNI